MTELPTGSPRIAYQRLAEDLRKALSEGQFDNGRQLPTELELSGSYGVGRQTVRRALQELVSDGLVFRVRGRGTFATPQSVGGEYLRSFASIEEVLAISEDTLLETITPLHRRTDVDAASRLQLPSDEVVTGLFRRVHANRYLSTTRVHFPLDIGLRVIKAEVVPTPGELRAMTIVGFVDEDSGRAIAGAQQSISATGAPAECARLIDLAAGAPALRIDRLYFDVDNRFVQLAVSYYNPDRYTYRLQLHRRRPSRNGANS